jgi:hypothetical protein
LIFMIIGLEKKTKRKKDKYLGFPRPGGDFVAPGKNHELERLKN